MTSRAVLERRAHDARNSVTEDHAHRAGPLVTSGEVPMRYLKITDDTDIPTLCEGIKNLRAKQRAEHNAQVAGWIGADIDEMLELLHLQLLVS